MRPRNRSTGTGQQWPVYVVALRTLLNGLTSILSVLLVRFRPPAFVTEVLPFGLYHWSRPATVALGFLLIYLSYNLWHRRLAAWWAATIVSVLILAGDFIHPRLWPEAVAPAVTLVVLLVFRRRFRVRSGIRGIAQGLTLTAISLAIGLGFGTLGFWLLPHRDFGMTFTPMEALIRTLRQYLLIGNSDLVAHTAFARTFLRSLNVMGILTGAFAVYSFFRPVAYRLVSVPRDLADATAIVSQHARGSYDYFAARPDKSCFFSKSRRTFIAYRTVGGVALCLGDPIGPDDEIERTVTDFLTVCADNAWLAVFLMPDRVPLYQKSGLSLLKVGEEGIIDLHRFQEETIKKKYFRYVKRKMEGEGYRFERHKPPHTSDLLDDVERVSREWLTLPHHRELGFLQGTFSRRYLGETIVSGVRSSTGQLVAWVNEVPSFRPGEATFDMMRHLPGVHWGIMDYLFMNMMVAQADEGHRTINMGLAPLAGVGERAQATLLERAVHQIYEHIGGVVSVKGLRQYKVKFEPSWEERFIAYQGGAIGLIRIGLAISRVL